MLGKARGKGTRQGAKDNYECLKLGSAVGLGAGECRDGIAIRQGDLSGEQTLQQRSPAQKCDRRLLDVWRLEIPTGMRDGLM